VESHRDELVSVSEIVACVFSGNGAFKDFSDDFAAVDKKALSMESGESLSTFMLSCSIDSVEGANVWVVREVVELVGGERHLSVLVFILAHVSFDGEG
jgi:hypothetical protein